VARFIANERKCCPFLHIEVEIAPGAGPMWLRLTGPPGTRELIEAELALATAGPCNCCAESQPASPAASDCSVTGITWCTSRRRRRAPRAVPVRHRERRDG
jgi:hypothetical protein